MELEKKVKEILINGTLIVEKALSGKINITDFVKEYDNFYYFNALDGHEANDEMKTLLDKYSGIIELHEKIQRNIVDLIYLGDEQQLQDYLKAGRITPEQGLEGIKKIVSQSIINEMIKKLQ